MGHIRQALTNRATQVLNWEGSTLVEYLLHNLTVEHRPFSISRVPY